MKLFELANQFRALEDMALTDELPAELIADTLEGLQGEFDDKAIACAKFILSLEADAKAIRQASEAMRARAERVQRRADSVRAYLLFQCQAIDRKRIDSAELVIRRAVNPPAIQIRDEDLIPTKFWVQPPAPPPRLDKKLLRGALEEGIQIEGVYMESGERLEIKV